MLEDLIEDLIEDVKHYENSSQARDEFRDLVERQFRNLTKATQIIFLDKLQEQITKLSGRWDVVVNVPEVCVEIIKAIKE